jgi:hypothetical protein
VAILFLPSCTPLESSPLLWNKEDLTFVGAYEENGVTFTARFAVMADDGGGIGAPALLGRIASVTLLSPHEVEGIVYRLDGEGMSVARQGESFPLSSIPAPIAALLLFFPEGAALGGVEIDGATRTETVYAEDGTYTYIYPLDGHRPNAVRKTDGVTHESLTVTAWE